MSNLAELAWTASLSMLTLGGLCLAVYIIAYFRKKTFDKKIILILILLIAYFIYIGIPYISDFIGQETKSLHGTVIEEKTFTYKLSRTVYSYTLQAENGDQVVVYVDEQYYDTLGMEVGKEYNISYFAHSNAVNDVMK